MYKTNQLLLLCLFIIAMTSCKKDDLPNEIEEPDFSIQSTTDFAVISQYENGWIKEGRYPASGNPMKEFEYYENGYIKTAKIYSTLGAYHLSMEVARSINNKPEWSKYYYSDGSLWIETIYENGLPSVKKVYDNKRITTHEYTDGMLTSSTFLSNDESITTSNKLNASASNRTVSVYVNDNTYFEQTSTFEPKLGDGLYSDFEIQVGNPFGEIEGDYINLFESYATSPSWERYLEAANFVRPYILLDQTYISGNEFIRSFAISTELYQSIIEQYPFNEQGILVGGSRYIDGYSNIQLPFDVRDSLANVYENDSANYVLKYGDEYIEKIGYGKSMMLIGAIRNLPTNALLADELRQIADKKLDALTSENSPALTAEEQAMLDKVWFEVRFFSYVPEHRSGVVINSYQDYQQTVEAVDDAELSVIQLEYKSCEYL
jgi:hypothetical protein